MTIEEFDDLPIVKRLVFMSMTAQERRQFRLWVLNRRVVVSLEQAFDQWLERYQDQHSGKPE